MDAKITLSWVCVIACFITLIVRPCMSLYSDNLIQPLNTTELVFIGLVVGVRFIERLLNSIKIR